MVNTDPSGKFLPVLAVFLVDALITATTTAIISGAIGGTVAGLVSVANNGKFFDGFSSGFLSGFKSGFIQGGVGFLTGGLGAALGVASESLTHLAGGIAVGTLSSIGSRNFGEGLLNFGLGFTSGCIGSIGGHAAHQTAGKGTVTSIMNLKDQFIMDFSKSVTAFNPFDWTDASSVKLKLKPVAN